MKILLINANPVVSRLLTLCTRDRHLLLDEVTNIDEVGAGAYDLLFVDDGTDVEALNSLLNDDNIEKKVFISYTKEAEKGFDEVIQKPFLPSQIIKIIKSIEVKELEDKAEDKNFIFLLASEEVRVEKKSEVLEALPLEALDINEIEKIKSLLEIDDEEPEFLDHLSEDKVHIRKAEVIREQLILEGLEILNEDEIVDELSAKIKGKVHKHQKKRKRKQKILHCNKKELSKIDAAMTRSLENLKPKTMKKFLKGKSISIEIQLKESK